ncbi:MAG: SGNH/GDSL hydrolase family protein [Pirellulales bacterium]
MSQRTFVASFAFLFFGWISSYIPSSTIVNAADGLEIRPSERIVLVGGTFVERLQSYGQFETGLVSGRREMGVTLRNLGWSGDTVWGDARAVFGGPQDGFKRLVKDVEQAQPTLLLIQYGGNEANAGAAGLGEFVAQYRKLLDALATTKARIVLLSPIRRERAAATHPDPATYNAVLKQYCEAIARVANERQLVYIDLQDLFDNSPLVNGQSGRAPMPLTDNGLHPTEAGFAIVSERLLSKLGIPSGRWSVVVEGEDAKASGLRVADFTRGRDSVRFQATASQLPPTNRSMNGLPYGPGTESQSLQPIQHVEPSCRLRVLRLDAGSYELLVDGLRVALADASLWGDPGVGFDVPGDQEQAEKVRQLIYDKNVLYFHRYRPQNETYLFLFRKHEQGNNAVEIPQFDPLVAEKEAEIAKLLTPNAHRFELRKAP